MTENYLNKVQPIDRNTAVKYWKSYRAYIYKYLTRIKYPDKEDAYNQAYIFIEQALRYYKSDKGFNLKSWVLTCLKPKLRAYCFETFNAIKRPSHLLYKNESTSYNMNIQYIDNIYNEAGEDKNNVNSNKGDVKSNNYTPEYYIASGDVRRLIEKALKVLTPEQEYLIKNYYGIQTTKKTLRYLAEEANTSCENIRGKITRILSRMKKYIENRNINIGDLLDYEA